MKDRGYWDDNRWVQNPKPTYTFETGSKVEFLSVDTYGKAHGPRRDVLFLNEANNIPYNIADQLITRTRKTIWLDWNPVSEFWFYEKFKDVRKDMDFITLTFKDNEALDEGTLGEIYAHKNDPRWWKVYGLGELGETEGKIYNNWKVIDEIPHEANLEGYGLDFGYTNDPTAIIAVYYYNGGYVIDEIAFTKGLSNKQIADILVNQRKALVIADSAEPKSIDEIASYGVNISGVQKKGVRWQSFVNWSIDVVKSQQISITKKSLNIIKEYRNYLWKVDRDGKVLNEPEHMFSHSMDAIRYRLCSLAPVKRIEEEWEQWPTLDKKTRVNRGI